MIQMFAILYFAICIGTVLFQICIIVGAPWGRLTQGGTHPGKLPVGNRIGAGFSICLLILMGLSIYSAAGNLPNWPYWTGWVALGITGISVILNLITPSALERKLWGPITIVMFAFATIVMLSG